MIKNYCDNKICGEEIKSKHPNNISVVSVNRYSKRIVQEFFGVISEGGYGGKEFLLCDKCFVVIMKLFLEDKKHKNKVKI